MCVVDWLCVCVVDWLCSGRQVLEWNVPYNMSRAGSHLSTVDCRGSGLFCTRLRISTATVNETGEYRCSYTGLVPEEAKTSAAVYVYVQGRGQG